MSMSSLRVRTCQTHRPKALSKHFRNVLADNGGPLLSTSIGASKPWPIKINKNRKGHYAFLRSDAPGTAVAGDGTPDGLHEDVMRVLTISVDGHEEGPSVQMQKRDERGERGERRERPEA